MFEVRLLGDRGTNKDFWGYLACGELGKKSARQILCSIGGISIKKFPDGNEMMKVPFRAANSRFFNNISTCPSSDLNS